MPRSFQGDSRQQRKHDPVPHGPQCHLSLLSKLPQISDDSTLGLRFRAKCELSDQIRQAAVWHPEFLGQQGQPNHNHNGKASSSRGHQIFPYRRCRISGLLVYNLLLPGQHEQHARCTLLARLGISHHELQPSKELQPQLKNHQLHLIRLLWWGRLQILLLDRFRCTAQPCSYLWLYRSEANCIDYLCWSLWGSNCQHFIFEWLPLCSQAICQNNRCVFISQVRVIQHLPALIFDYFRHSQTV